MFETNFKRAKPILNLFKPYLKPKIENQRGAAAEGRPSILVKKYGLNWFKLGFARLK